MSNCTKKPAKRKAAIDRPPKPYAEFPLGPANNGCWQKKIRGKIVYFGRWGRVVNGSLKRLPGDGWKEALELYKAQADDLYAGRTPRIRKTGDGLKIKDLCNTFLTAKLRLKQSGEITAPTFEGHNQTTDLLIGFFGKDRLVDDLAADDFGSLRQAMAERWGPVRLGNEIVRVRSVFKYGYEARLIENEVRYGPEFKKPSAAVLRKHKAKNGQRMLEANEIRKVLDSLQDNPTLRAMFLLGVNAGFNNKDIADLPLTALDLEGGFVNFPRPKTGVDRRCPLWPETVAALKQAIEVRPEPKHKEAEGLVFVTTRGRPWLSRGVANPVSVATTAILKTAGVHRAGIGFATLRHVFRTVADGCRDQPAIFHIMGHATNSMRDIYTERIDDERLIAVTDHVRAWLWPEGGAK